MNFKFNKNLFIYYTIILSIITIIAIISIRLLWINGIANPNRVSFVLEASNIVDTYSDSKINQVKDF